MSPSGNRDIFSIDTDPTLLIKFPGLSTKNALKRLYYDILNFKNEVCNKEKKKYICQKVIRSSFHHSSYFSTFSWIPICVLFLIISALTLFTSSKYVNTGMQILFSFTQNYAGIVMIFFYRFTVMNITLLTILNIAIVYWDNYSRFHEFENRIDSVLETLKKTQNKVNWNAEQFPNLYTPHSPSVSLQWTIRDGKLINLPSVLLAQGDIIIMRPGHVAPADVETVLPPPSEDNKYNVLVTDQLLACDSNVQSVDVMESETLRSVERSPIADRLYAVTKAPYISQLKAISNKYLEKPTSLYDKARYLLFGKCLHHVILPACFVLCELLSVIRWYIFSILHCQHYSETERWTYFFITETSSVLIPLISLVFPVFWFLSNAVGNALLLTCFSAMDEDIKKPERNERESKTNNSYYEDLEASPKGCNYEVAKVQRNKFWRYLIKFIRNNGSIIVRSANFLHTMASVTVLCCVDKKGVLSFPNPIAEKVFFMKNSVNKGPQRKSGDIKSGGRLTGDSNNDGDVHKVTEDSQNEKASKMIFPRVEILDITPRDEKGSAWKIEFDDSRWRAHITSLKPIGLAILLNTCNRETHKSYNHFCAHITSHALQNKHLVPVANRRCLCELARQIGFHENTVVDKYSLELQLFTYKSLAGNKYVQALFKTRKPKFPFPHGMSVIVSNGGTRNNKVRSGAIRKDEERKRKRSEKEYSENQMFSQGTADVILDYCVDYWDGYDVHPLTPGIRKKILDFYQRSSLTAYCSGFSYRPIYKSVKYTPGNNSSTVYLELLKNIDTRRQRRRHHRSEKHCDIKKNPIHRDISIDAPFIRGDKESLAVLQDVIVECDEEVEDDIEDNVHDYDENINQSIDEYDGFTEFHDFSDDSDEQDEEECDNFDTDESRNKKREESLSNSRSRSSERNINDFQVLGKQIFLGMVSMQYQPLVDMVQMIEDLEKACIRFVHFSKENELRSRVFSEKMGLESGWNCHISLLPDSDANQLVDGYGENEGINVGTDLEISSTVETGASSADDEENIPFTFDISNRAKLPCGIRNIRPHLEQVDNVPLLVSLFTDCTSDTTEQMLTIMQEYGQVVCVLGSSANIKNFSLFARADASISVEPLYAQVCQQIPSSTSNEKIKDLQKGLPPIELSQLLNSLPCSLILQRNYNYQRILPLYPLIADSRNLMRLIWNCSQYWLCCIVLMFTVQIGALLLFLPAIFTLEQALWISAVMIPCLSISLATAPYDKAIMNKTKGKDWLCSVNWTTIKYAVTCYGSKLLCGAVSMLTFYVLQLVAVCDCLGSQYAAHWNNTSTASSTPFHNKKRCVYVFIFFDVDDEKMEAEYMNTLDIIQCHMAFMFSLNLVALCLSFLHRDTVCWKRIPRFNVVWLLFVLLPLSVQVIHFVLLVHYWSTDCQLSTISVSSLRSLLFTFFSPCLTYLISEIVKIQEIRINERYQKKVRLEFGTKLGMNSPF